MTGYNYNGTFITIDEAEKRGVLGSAGCVPVTTSVVPSTTAPPETTEPSSSSSPSMVEVKKHNKVYIYDINRQRPSTMCTYNIDGIHVYSLASKFRIGNMLPSSAACLLANEIGMAHYAQKVYRKYAALEKEYRGTGKSVNFGTHAFKDALTLRHIHNNINLLCDRVASITGRPELVGAPRLTSTNAFDIVARDQVKWYIERQQCIIDAMHNEYPLDIPGELLPIYIMMYAKCHGHDINPSLGYMFAIATRSTPLSGAIRTRLRDAFKIDANMQLVHKKEKTVMGSMVPGKGIVTSYSQVAVLGIDKLLYLCPVDGIEGILDPSAEYNIHQQLITRFKRWKKEEAFKVPTGKHEHGRLTTAHVIKQATKLVTSVTFTREHERRTTTREQVSDKQSHTRSTINRSINPDGSSTEVEQRETVSRTQTLTREKMHAEIDRLVLSVERAKTLGSTQNIVFSDPVVKCAHRQILDARKLFVDTYNSHSGLLTRGNDNELMLLFDFAFATGLPALLADFSLEELYTVSDHLGTIADERYPFLEHVIFYILVNNFCMTHAKMYPPKRNQHIWTTHYPGHNSTQFKFASCIPTLYVRASLSPDDEHIIDIKPQHRKLPLPPPTEDYIASETVDANGQVLREFDRSDCMERKDKNEVTEMTASFAGMFTTKHDVSDNTTKHISKRYNHRVVNDEKKDDDGEGGCGFTLDGGTMVEYADELKSIIDTMDGFKCNVQVPKQAKGVILRENAFITKRIGMFAKKLYFREDPNLDPITLTRQAHEQLKTELPSIVTGRNGIVKKL